MSADIQSADDFLDGQKDCQRGVKPKAGASEDYRRGYACEYAREQLATELGLSEFRRSYGFKQAI